VEDAAAWLLRATAFVEAANFEFDIQLVAHVEEGARQAPQCAGAQIITPEHFLTGR